jgi:hypothetical protein
MICRRPIDDPEIKTMLKLEDELFDEFGSGILEDIVPYLKDIYPTAKWKKLSSNMNKLLDILQKKFKQHVDTFKPG